MYIYILLSSHQAVLHILIISMTCSLQRPAHCKITTFKTPPHYPLSRMGIQGGWVFVNCRNVCFFSFGNIGMEPYTQMPLGIWQIPPVIWQISKYKNLEIVINVEMCSMMQLHHSRASFEHRDMYFDKIPWARKTHYAKVLRMGYDICNV